MDVFNVLFKGVEKNVTPFAQIFATEEKAREWCRKVAIAQGLEIKSTLGKSDDEWTLDDYRLEDKEGNSYYLVIYKQELDLAELIVN